MHYLLIGEDREAKEAKIAELKKKFLQEKQAFYTFDFDVLYADKLNPDDLKKALLSLPALAVQRLILIRELPKLSSRNQEILLQCLQSRSKHVVLILEADQLERNAGWVQELKPFVQITEFSLPPPLNVFDMTRAIEKHRAAEALKIQFQLIQEGVHPLQILGGLVWFWARTKGGSSRSFLKGLQALQEADWQIKRSRLEPQHSLEVLVVKLCTL